MIFRKLFLGLLNRVLMCKLIAAFTKLRRTKFQLKKIVAIRNMIKPFPTTNLFAI